MAWKTIISTTIASVLIFGIASVVSAAIWYAGNSRINGYGVRANIYTPSSAPYSPTFQYHWVSTPSTPNWVQAGWFYGPGYGSATKYVEHLVGGQYKLDPYGPQLWGDFVNYRVDSNNVNAYYAYINGSNKGGWGPIPIPTQMQAYSEVHDSSSTVIDTHFSDVSSRNSSGSNWTLFNQANWREDAPYKVQKSYLYDYRTYK